MKNYTVKRYLPEDYTLWNAFVSHAKNATFLFQRDFMEYHSDRFSDFSLMVFEGEKLISVIPANRAGAVVYSHQGLTYGGFVFEANVKMKTALAAIREVLEFLHKQQIDSLQLKTIPAMYCDYFSEEINYACFLMSAKLVRRDCLSVIDLSTPLSFTKTRKESIRRGKKNDLEIREDLQFELFWNDILQPNLIKKHNAKPVHSLAEIQKLQKSFPQNIRHFNVYHQNKIVAGTTVFVTGNVAHPQYISGNDNNNELGSLDYLYDYLIQDVFNDKKYFDFGPSHEQNGTKINDGILFWKNSFGAKITVQDFYDIPTSNYHLLENILI